MVTALWVKFEDISSLLKFFDGIMIGRIAWDNPWIFNKIENKEITKLEVIDQYLSYIGNKNNFDFPKTILLRPLFNLFYGEKGSKSWKQSLNSFCFKSKSLVSLYTLAKRIESSNHLNHELSV